LRAFSVLPAMNLAIYDHFLAPSSSKTYSSSLRSSWGDQGPLWILGLRKQFQCSLHCLGVRKTLFLAGFRSYKSWDTNFQLSLPCYATASESSRDSPFDHLCVTKRTFLSPSHRNLHFCQLLPETSDAINSQSSLC
jgi:hypothetical protein